MRVLVTGAAGFIGSHVVVALLARGDDVVGLDNLNDYYDPALKWARLARIQRFAKGLGRDDDDVPDHGDRALGRFRLQELELADRERIAALFADAEIDRVVHLAAQAGVRHSLENPFLYVDSNIIGFLTVLEGCRRHSVEHLVYASTSSVYGLNTNIPFTVTEPADHPIALYGATKRANELMAHSYSQLFRLPTTGLRFFTVYGPWGRPDMALFKFTEAMLAGEPIQVFNHGNHVRDFTYCDDIVRGIIAALDRPPEGDPNWRGTHPAPDRSSAPWRLYNIGNQRPVELMKYIELLESELGIRADKTFLPLQPGDVPATYADVETFVEDTHYRPSTPVDVGVRKFVRWYRRYHDV